MESISLGDVVQDLVSGCTGIAVAEYLELGGVRMVHVQPYSTAGALPPVTVLPESRLRMVKRGPWVDGHTPARTPAHRAV